MNNSVNESYDACLTLIKYPEHFEYRFLIDVLVVVVVVVTGLIRVTQVNGDALLTVEYDDGDSEGPGGGGGGTETVYGRDRQRLLTVRYDASGRQVRCQRYTFT